MTSFIEAAAKTMVRQIETAQRMIKDMRMFIALTALGGGGFRHGCHHRAVTFRKIFLRHFLQVGLSDAIVLVPNRIDQTRIVVINREMAQRIGSRTSAVKLLGALA